MNLDVKVAIKAPLIVNKGQGRITCIQEDGSEMTYPSLNNAIRRELRLFVNPRRVRGFPGISGIYEAMDFVIMREITEDVYIGWEHKIGDVAAQAIKLTTREAATRVARYSFEYARTQGRKLVSCLHKANVLNYTDGLFLREVRRVDARIRLLVDGSLVMSKVDEPGDVDVVLVLPAGWDFGAELPPFA